MGKAHVFGYFFFHCVCVRASKEGKWLLSFVLCVHIMHNEPLCVVHNTNPKYSRIDICGVLFHNTFTF